MLPFTGVSIGLLYHNWFPSYVFVGDTYCYFAGMTFAVVGILGHFSKTMMLFFIPQTINFLYSVPQLFKLIPCPRHRLPKFDLDSGLMTMSMAEFDIKDLSGPGRLCLWLLRALKLVYCEQDGDTVRINNLTILNLTLRVCGPMREDKLTAVLLAVQAIFSLVGFFVRYELAKLVYKVVT
jgi:UDP-N-acetylglucosamine--dolichyl-phosphate N-acetylglucosaminephosphotransferase